MQTPLTIMPPRFVLSIPDKQAELLEHLCRWDQPSQVHSAMLDACNFIEAKVKPEHYGEPFVQAAAFLLLMEFAYNRRGQTRKQPKCLKQVLTLIEPFRKGFQLYG